MPRGINGFIVYVKYVCPICDKKCEYPLGRERETCSWECGQKLRGERSRKPHTKIGELRKKSEGKIQRELREIKDKEAKINIKHLQTIFTGGYDDGFVICNEGEIL